MTTQTPSHEAAVEQDIEARSHADGPLPVVPTTLGRYEIQSEIGHGSMGVVYKAADRVLGRSVALKVIRITSPVGEPQQLILEQRFLREATLAASLSHPNIVVVHDVGRDPRTRTLFIALEYLEGQTLAALLATGESMDWRVAARLTAQLADALHHAHGHGVVHRDIKPSNIMMLPCGQAKILDFGVAKQPGALLTSPGEVWGTPYYMSPEHASGGKVDGRSDIFSLGAVLYELVTSRRPFDGPGAAPVIHRLLYEEPPRPRWLNAALPPALDAVLARALAKNPDKRYPDGRQLAEDLEDILLSRPLRARAALAPASVFPSVEREPSRPLDLSPPTLTTRFRPPGRGLRVLRRPAAWIPNATVGTIVGLGTAAIVFGAAIETVHISRAVADTRAAVAPLPSALPAPPPPAALEARAVPSSPWILAPAHVAITLEHGFKHGRVKIWVDDKLVRDAPLAAASETRHLLFFTKRKGVFADVLDVAPGKHTVRCEVDGDGEKRQGWLRGSLRSDQTRLLDVRAGGKLSLEWMS